MPRCSAIVVTYNSSLQIEACLRALATQDCEIVVVDNASQDDTVRRIELLEESIPLRLVTISKNIGFAGGVNQGARAAVGDVLLLVNPDAVAQPGAIDALLDCFSRTEASAVGGALLDAAGQPAKGFVFRRLPTLSSLMLEALLVNQLWPGNPVNRRYRCLDADFSREQEVEQPAGACLGVTRAAWEKLQGMDEKFFPAWFEDVDVCARLLRGGGEIVYCPLARFRHTGAHSVGQMSFADKQIFWYTNMLRYAGKHFPWWESVTLRVGILAGMALRVLASLLGGAPHGVPVGSAVGAYLRVAAAAVGAR